MVIQILGKLTKYRAKKKQQWTLCLRIVNTFWNYNSGGKRQLVLDRKVLYENIIITSSFQHPFTLEGFGLNDFSHIFNHNNLICQIQEIKQEGLSRMTKMNQKQSFYATFRQQSYFKQKINLNIEFENHKDINGFYQKQPIAQYMKLSTIFGQWSIEEFESFSKVQMTMNPFENSFQVQGFSSPMITQTVQQQQNILLKSNRN
ncbi:unnamed protein product [Paramecium pentaurelia]|uniref:Uncharacterized protein n=1 Tax=Paramecium pentaurelia TaxID=43138 RepID=A0A8S1WFF7_9CILI|nr:unnamed protein product [Paramecium pentaurelia]